MRPPNPFFFSPIPQGMWVYTLSGYVEYEERGRVTRLGAGSVLAVHQPARGTLVYHKKGLPWRRIYIGVTGAAAMELFDYLTHQFGQTYELPSRCKAVQAARALCRLASERSERPAQFWSVEVFKWLNVWWSSCEKQLPKGVHLEDLDANSLELLSLSRGSVKEFAERMGYSRSYLSRRLKRIWRRNPSEVLRQLRLDEATRLLRDTPLPIGEVADKAGFGSSSAFCVAFKKRFGTTALGYRHQHTKVG